MTYRVSISESTIERLREYAKKAFPEGDITSAIGLPGHFLLTVEDIIVDMLEKEGF